jgi:hypothetical protein
MVNRTKSIGFLIAAVACGGCGIEPETLEALKQAVNQASSKGLAANSTDANREGQEDEGASGFQPAFPDRIDPFVFQGIADHRDEFAPLPKTSEDRLAVDVLGFAVVDQPTVLLRIMGKTHSLSVGQRVDGMEVVGIDPPHAELRIGSQTRTVSMFDRP